MKLVKIVENNIEELNIDKELNEKEQYYFLNRLLNSNKISDSKLKSIIRKERKKDSENKS